MSAEIYPLPWSPGPNEGWDGAVTVSVTDFRYQRTEDMEACIPLGIKLGDAWPVMHGAVGLTLWAMPGELRIGSVSVWLRKSDLQRFVRWPVHQDVVRQFRDRGTLGHATSTWTADSFDPAVAWQEAVRRLAEADAP